MRASEGRDCAVLPLGGFTAVFLHAHPDDEAIFTGITMRRLADLGARVVLVTATSGEEGTARCSLTVGEPLAARRTAELERAAAVLGVSRLVLLGYRDSGMAGDSANGHRDAFARADPGRVARRLVGLLEQEQASVLVHYDSDGIYRHPDHLAVHCAGARAAALSQVPSYQTTISRELLSRRPHHLLAQGKSASWRRDAGRPEKDIHLTVKGSARELMSKRDAILEHSSQVTTGSLAGLDLRTTYGREWYVRPDAGLTWAADRGRPRAPAAPPSGYLPDGGPCGTFEEAG
jgi:LmbE family N-acetylglucosaminyl deacetylase